LILSFNRSCWGSYGWSNVKGCLWARNLGPWWSVGRKVYDHILLLR